MCYLTGPGIEAQTFCADGDVFNNYTNSLKVNGTRSRPADEGRPSGTVVPNILLGVVTSNIDTLLSDMNRHVSPATKILITMVEGTLFLVPSTTPFHVTDHKQMA